MTVRHVNKHAAKTFALTMIAILAFAGNSLLTRMALTRPEIGASQFFGIRLISGAAMLVLLNLKQRSAIWPRYADIPGIVFLFVYAVTFTFAYMTLGAASGALILFPTVQLTLVVVATLRGSPPSSRQRMGMIIAVAGLLVLLGPRSSSPPLGGAFLMVLAGVAWGMYTLLGRDAVNPFARTARNFLGAAPLALIVMCVIGFATPTAEGILLAIASGAITSALGYVVWYAVLPRLNVATAGAAQLFVPVVTAVGGVVWLGEAPSVAMLAAIALILSGVALTNRT